MGYSPQGHKELDTTEATDTEVASHCGEQAVGTQASSVAAMGSAVASHSSRAQAQ